MHPHDFYISRLTYNGSRFTDYEKEAALVPQADMKIITAQTDKPFFSSIDTIDIAIAAVIIGIIALLFLPSIVRRIRGRNR